MSILCFMPLLPFQGFPGGSDGKEPSCNAGDRGSISGWGRPPGEGNGNPIQYSCLENPMDRGAWWVTVHGVAKESDTTKWLAHTHFHFRGCVYSFAIVESLSHVWLFVTPMDCSTPGFPVLHYLPEVAHTHVHMTIFLLGFESFSNISRKSWEGFFDLGCNEEFCQNWARKGWDTVLGMYYPVCGEDVLITSRKPHLFPRFGNSTSFQGGA